MNFLSHYYFDRYSKDDALVMGTVLPDFIKNTNKEWNLYPQKEESLFTADPSLNSYLQGWKRHIEVDRIFHNSYFFEARHLELKELILPVMQGSPVKPFFLSHIGLELVLDHLLIADDKINVQSFYDHLAKANNSSLALFLDKAGIESSDLFSNFMKNFLSSRYLLSYQKIENLTYALNRICMRIWPIPFNDGQLNGLTEKLRLFAKHLSKDYFSIYQEIEEEMKHFS